MDIGARIRELREAKGYTVNHLANVAGIAQSNLRDLELNKKSPTVATIGDICWALGISLRDFFAQEITDAWESDQLQQEIFRLDEEQKKALRTFLHAMRENKK